LGTPETERHDLPLQELLPERSGALVLRSWVDAGDMESLLHRIFGWAERRESRYICTINVHSAVTADWNARYREVVNRADGNTADGWPVAWVMRRQGHAGQPRVCGPDLMWRIASQAATQDKSIYLYGGTPDTLVALERRLREAFPDLRIAGSFSPPFRPLSHEEDEQAVAAINESGAAIVMVGLGCPKQEMWMAEHRGRVHAVMVGVGAAFDFLSGRVPRAPIWMQRAGLEWLHRLAQEPLRLGARYLNTNTWFVCRTAGQLAAAMVRERKVRPYETA